MAQAVDEEGRRRRRLIQVQKLGPLHRPGERLVRHEQLPTQGEVRTHYAPLLKSLWTQHQCVHCGTPHNALDNFEDYRCVVHGVATPRYSTKHGRMVWACCGALPHSIGCIPCIHSATFEMRLGIESAIHYNNNDMMVAIPNELIDHGLVLISERMYQRREHKKTFVYGIWRPPGYLLWDTRGAGRGPELQQRRRP